MLVVPQGSDGRPASNRSLTCSLWSPFGSPPRALAVRRTRSSSTGCSIYSPGRRGPVLPACLPPCPGTYLERSMALSLAGRAGPSSPCVRDPITAKRAEGTITVVWIVLLHLLHAWLPARMLACLAGLPSAMLLALLLSTLISPAAARAPSSTFSSGSCCCSRVVAC